MFVRDAEIKSITVHDNLNINFTNGDNCGDEISAIAALPLWQLLRGCKAGVASIGYL